MILLSLQSSGVGTTACMARVSKAVPGGSGGPKTTHRREIIEDGYLGLCGMIHDGVIEVEVIAAPAVDLA